MMRPTALVLTLLVASIATIRFGRAGFSWELFWPFALGSIPLACLGGAITLLGHWSRMLVGLALWAAAARCGSICDSTGRRRRHESPRSCAAPAGEAVDAQHVQHGGAREGHGERVRPLLHQGGMRRLSSPRCDES